MSIIEHLTLILVAFSVPCMLALMVAYVCFLETMRKTVASRIACVVLLGLLIALQIAHYRWLLVGGALLEDRVYLQFLMAVPAAFWFASRSVLMPDAPWRPVHLLHVVALPPIGLFAPPAVVTPVAFLIGAGYTLWLARTVLASRAHSARFRFERFFFLLFALLAVVALGLGVTISWLVPDLFLLAYANLIGGCTLLVLTALLAFPELLSDIAEVADRTYARSRLEGLDVDALVTRLEALMNDESVYENEDLDLETLAGLLGIQGHQLSELVNRHFGTGLPRYLREKRVAAAQRLLVQEPSASVLAIGLMVGFRSQSSFYAAFREILGTSPGNYRKDAISS